MLVKTIDELKSIGKYFIEIGNILDDDRFGFSLLDYIDELTRGSTPVVIKNGASDGKKENKHKAPKYSKFKSDNLKFLVEVLMDLGLTEGLMDLAQTLYLKAVDAEAFDLASQMAFLLAQHYSLYEMDQRLAEKFWALYEDARSKDYIAKKTLFSSGHFAMFHDHGYQLSRPLINRAESLILETEKSLRRDVLQKQWLGWLMYKLTILTEKELYHQLIILAEKAYAEAETRYYESLKARLAILTHLLPSYLATNQFEKVLDYKDEILDGASTSPTRNKCIMWLTRAALNLEEIALAEELVSRMENDNSTEGWKNILEQYICLLRGKCEKPRKEIRINETDRTSQLVAKCSLSLCSQLLDHGEILNSSAFSIVNRVSRQRVIRFITFVDQACRKSGQSFASLGLSHEPVQPRHETQKKSMEVLTGEVVRYDVLLDLLPGRI